MKGTEDQDAVLEQVLTICANDRDTVLEQAQQQQTVLTFIKPCAVS